MDMPPETAPLGMPVWRSPGALAAGRGGPGPQCRRVAAGDREIPPLPRNLSPPGVPGSGSPRVWLSSASLSGLHRLAKLSVEQKRFDVLHAHFGPVANSFSIREGTLARAAGGEFSRP